MPISDKVKNLLKLAFPEFGKSIVFKKEIKTAESLLNPESVKEVEKRKEVQRFIICPLCGHHKKLDKASQFGVGSKERIKKQKILARLKEKYGEEFTESKTPVVIRNHQEYKYRHSNLISKYHKIFQTVKKKLTNIPEEYIDTFFYTINDDEEDKPFIRQYMFKGFSIDDPFISFRINFGNIGVPYISVYISLVAQLLIETKFKSLKEAKPEEIQETLTQNEAENLLDVDWDDTFGDFNASIPEQIFENLAEIMRKNQDGDIQRGLKEIGTLSIREVVALYKYFIEGDPKLTKLNAILNVYVKKITEDSDKDMIEDVIYNTAIAICYLYYLVIDIVQEAERFSQEVKSII